MPVFHVVYVHVFGFALFIYYLCHSYVLVSLIIPRLWCMFMWDVIMSRTTLFFSGYAVIITYVIKLCVLVSLRIGVCLFLEITMTGITAVIAMIWSWSLGSFMQSLHLAYYEDKEYPVTHLSSEAGIGSVSCWQERRIDFTMQSEWIKIVSSHLFSFLQVGVYY